MIIHLDEQIETLRTEAAQAGDLEQVALCEWALGRLTGAADALAGSRWAEEGTTRASARVECERVIREAQQEAGFAGGAPVSNGPGTTDAQWTAAIHRYLAWEVLIDGTHDSWHRTRSDARACAHWWRRHPEVRDRVRRGGCPITVRRVVR